MNEGHQRVVDRLDVRRGVVGVHVGHHIRCGPKPLHAMRKRCNAGFAGEDFDHLAARQRKRSPEARARSEGRYRPVRFNGSDRAARNARCSREGLLGDATQQAELGQRRV